MARVHVKLAVYESVDETLILEVDKNGRHVGKNRFFKPGMGRDLNNYDVTIGEAPITITPRMKVSVDRLCR